MYSSPFGGGSFSPAGTFGGAKQYQNAGGSSYANPFEDPNYVKNPDNRMLEDTNGTPAMGLYTAPYADNTRFTSWLNDQMPRKYKEYTGAVANGNPTLTWFQSLQNWDPTTEFNNLDPYQRTGVRASTYATPVKFMGG